MILNQRADRILNIYQALFIVKNAQEIRKKGLHKQKINSQKKK